MKHVCKMSCEHDREGLNLKTQAAPGPEAGPEAGPEDNKHKQEMLMFTVLNQTYPE